MKPVYTKPLPSVTAENRPYWESVKAHEVRLQRCLECNRFRFPVTTYCPYCLGDATEWAAVSGRGTVYSFVIMHQVFNQAFKDDVPYNVTAVELAEGPRLYTNVVGCANAELFVGMQVDACYDDVTDEMTLLKFKPRSV